MKKIFIALFLIILIVPFVQVKGQTGNLSISQTNNDSIIDIKVYLKRTGATSWNLGFASLVINYNFISLNSPAEIGEGIWDNNSNFQYDDQIITSYDSNKSISIELGLNSPASGTTVPVDSILVGIIRFNISNPVQNHNIEWNSIYSSIINNNGNDITSNMNFYNPPNTPLPAELTSFTYLINGNTVHLNWVTANEINNYGFEIQRKNSDNNIWNSIGFVQGSINSNQIKNYEYEDKNLIKGIYLYRLK
ncbi:MAG: hypothetical protein LH629_02420, partial [Ignavibacteria bacterium]|nr:hypothetical protein [Ignavibacteria bacterium]